MIRWLQISSGRGPVECCWVVSQLANFLMNEARKAGLHAEIVEAIPSEFPKTLRSALIAIEGGNSIEGFISS